MFRYRKRKNRIRFNTYPIIISLVLFVNACSKGPTESNEPRLWYFDHEGEHEIELVVLGDVLSVTFTTAAQAEFLEILDDENNIHIEGTGSITGTQGSIGVDDTPEVYCRSSGPLEAEFTFDMSGNLSAGKLLFLPARIEFGSNNIDDGCGPPGIAEVSYKTLLAIMLMEPIQLRDNAKAEENWNPESEPIMVGVTEVGWKESHHIWQNTLYLDFTLEPLVP